MQLDIPIVKELSLAQKLHYPIIITIDNNITYATFDSNT